MAEAFMAALHSSWKKADRVGRKSEIAIAASLADSTPATPLSAAPASL
jgi:hypothetical protein